MQPYETGPIGTSLTAAAGLGDGVTYVAFGPAVSFRVGTSWSILGGIDGGAHLRNLAAAAAYRVGLAYGR